MEKLVAGQYEADGNVLHLWFPRPVHLQDPEGITAFFTEVVDDWIAGCPTKPFLLVNYANLHIRPDMSSAYADSVQAFAPMLRAIFRYGMTSDATGHFTGVAVTLGNLRMKAPANIYRTEAAAREAIRKARVTSPG